MLNDPCKSCRERKENFEQAIEDAMTHLDSAGIPENSIQRGLVKMHLACMSYPVIGLLATEMWPTNDTLVG